MKSLRLRGARCSTWISMADGWGNYDTSDQGLRKTQATLDREAKAAEQKRRVAAQAVLKKKTKAEKAREKDVAGLKDRIRSYLYDYKNKLEEAKSHFSAIDKNF